MIRWGRITAVTATAFFLLVAGSQARVPQLSFGKAIVVSCDGRAG